MARLLQVCTGSDFLQFTHELLRELSCDGIEVHICSGAGEELSELGQVPGVQVHPLHIERGIDPLADSRTLPRLVRLIRRVQPDIVHAHTPKAGLLAMIASKLARVPVSIYQMHGLRYETARGKRRELLRGADKLSCALANWVVCVSPSVRAKAGQDGLVSPSKSCVLHYGSSAGVDCTRFSPESALVAGQKLRASWGIAPGEPCIGFAGRLARDKGLLDLQESFLALKQGKLPRLHLLIAGQDDETDPVNLTRLHGAASVHFLGKVADPRPLYAASDVVVLPSYREGLSQVLLEAGAMGRALLACRVTGVTDIISHDDTGYLVEPHNALELSYALEVLLQSSSLRERLGKSARRQAVALYEPAQIYKETLQLYKSLSTAFL